MAEIKNKTKKMYFMILAYRIKKNLSCLTARITSMFLSSKLNGIFLIKYYKQKTRQTNKRNQNPAQENNQTENNYKNKKYNSRQDQNNPHHRSQNSGYKI